MRCRLRARALQLIKMCSTVSRVLHDPQLGGSERLMSEARVSTSEASQKHLSLPTALITRVPHAQFRFDVFVAVEAPDVIW